MLDNHASRSTSRKPSTAAGCRRHRLTSALARAANSSGPRANCACAGSSPNTALRSSPASVERHRSGATSLKISTSPPKSASPRRSSSSGPFITWIAAICSRYRMTARDLTQPLPESGRTREPARASCRRDDLMADTGIRQHGLQASGADCGGRQRPPPVAQQERARADRRRGRSELVPRDTDRRRSRDARFHGNPTLWA